MASTFQGLVCLACENISLGHSAPGPAGLHGPLGAGQASSKGCRPAPARAIAVPVRGRLIATAAARPTADRSRHTPFPHMLAHQRRRTRTKRHRAIAIRHGVGFARRATRSRLRRARPSRPAGRARPSPLCSAAGPPARALARPKPARQGSARGAPTARPHPPDRRPMGRGASVPINKSVEKRPKAVKPEMPGVGAALRRV